MSKIEKTGFIKSVGEIEYVGANSTPKQQIVLHIPGYQYQDRLVDDEDWQITLIGKSVDSHNIHPRSIGEKAKVSFWLKSREWEKEGKMMYIISANLASITWIPSESAPSS